MGAKRSDILQGTLDVLILQTLAIGPAHGHTIAHVIERRSEDVLQVEHGSLYPALHRLEERGRDCGILGDL
jgi:DNA-binding PadR family transcriptional regulator